MNERDSAVQFYKARQKEDLATISRLAHAIWWHTYGPLLSHEQVAFMLQEMYTETALKKQLLAGADIYILQRNNQAVGFMGIGRTQNHPILRIEKLYILPECQGLGLGKRFIAFARSLALKDGLDVLELNVNRHNPALAFYLKMGFRIVEEVDIPYFQFSLNDYIMQLPIDKP